MKWTHVEIGGGVATGTLHCGVVVVMRAGGGGADIGPLHRSLGTPMFGLSVDGQKYFEMHHTQKDVFELVNARELELGTASIASLVYLIDTYGL